MCDWRQLCRQNGLERTLANGAVFRIVYRPRPIPRIIPIGSNFCGVPVIWSLALVISLVTVMVVSRVVDFTTPHGATCGASHASQLPSLAR